MRARILLAAMTATLWGSACSSSSSTPQPGVSIDTPSVAAGGLGGLGDGVLSLSVGVVIELDVQPLDGSDDSTSITSDDPTTALALPMTDAHRFVLVGKKPGTIGLHFFIRGQETRNLSVQGSTTSTLPVEVSPQPPST